MTEEERAALAALRFNWAPVPDDVWRPSRFHVDGLHVDVTRDVLEGLADAEASHDSSPIGLILQGERGAGKTHLLGWVRQQVHQRDGYFFLVSLLDAKGFWDSVLASFVDGLSRPVSGDETQLRLFLRRLSARVGAPRRARRAVMGDTDLSRAALDTFIEGLVAYDPYVARGSQETARALALSVSEDVTHRDIAESYFACGEEAVAGERAAWGLRRAPKTAEEVVQDLSRLLALTGPTVIAVDQIDTLIAQSALAGDPRTWSAADASASWQQAVLLERIAGGLMGLRERTRRTLTVVACIPASWTLIRSKATDTVADRFRQAPQLKTIRDSRLGRAIVEKRFAAHFSSVDFKPPHPTWPVDPAAFDGAVDLTPRELLIRIDGHIRACLTAGRVQPLKHLAKPLPIESPGTEPASSAAMPAHDLGRFDDRFEALRKNADIATPLAKDGEDRAVPALIAAGLAAWIMERNEQSEIFTLDPPPGASPPLHARLRLTLDEEIEDQVHWCFRAITGDHHPVAALNRLRKACTAAGLDRDVAKRKLFLLRTSGWGAGPKTREAVEAFEKAGGATLPVHTADLRTLAALRTLLDEDPIEIRPWLLARKPAHDISIFREALADVDAWLPGRPSDDSGPAQTTVDYDPAAEPPPASASARPVTAAPVPEPARPVSTAPVPEPARPVSTAPVPEPARPVSTAPVPEPVGPAESARAPRQARPAPSAPAFTVGHRHDTGTPVRLPLESLRKHIAIFAGSGSGKTVLIRRIIEECALQGVSAVVLDPNNDLARLGDGWPEPPPQWRPHDAAAAADYLANTDVVVWSPRRETGRPLSFQPLPDFRSVRDDPDEFTEAVEAAVASLAPRAMLTGRAGKAHLGLAVLRKAVEHYGQRGGSRLKGLIDLLADLPDGTIDLDGADKIAAGLAQTLTAAMVNDPLFGGQGTPMDPGTLLTPREGKRARISVISFVGLASDDARQSFVNQLQMALFAWIKKHPAGDRPLLGLLVMDEAQTLAPSGAMTACTQSTLALASQARKYGLGLIFATQAPKGLHNRIPGNAATQFFGLLNSPIQIEAAREMAKAKGGDVPDISRLTSGEFYVAAEGGAPQKARTSLCLSYHPKSPLTTEEVLERARREPLD